MARKKHWPLFVALAAVPFVYAPIGIGVFGLTVSELADRTYFMVAGAVGAVLYLRS